jgi:DNA-directed RNA polymerase subunit H (RpoH/RPB5)
MRFCLTGDEEMSTGCVTFNEQKKEIILDHLVISNSDVYEILSDMKEDPESLDQFVKKGLIIGCIGLKQMGVVGSVDYIQKEFQKFISETNNVFNKMDIKNTDSPFFQMREVIQKYFDKENGQFKQMLNDYFSKDDGQIKQLIDQRFDLNNKESAFSKLIDTIKANSGMDKDAIAKLLDPNNADSPSPVKTLKEELFRQFKDLQDRDFKAIADRIRELKESEIKDIRDHLIGESASAEERDRGTQKGFDFEENVYNELEKIASVYEDIITQVGKTPGPFGKFGDILIDINGDEKKRIVIECKDSSINSSKALKDEISNAMKNRNASFGIFLFSKNENMPREYSPIKITHDYIVTCSEKENLYISYRLARVMLSKTSDIKEEVDFHKISGELSKIEENLKNIDNMQKEVSKIINSGNYLKDNLDELRRKIGSSVDKIEILLGEKHESKVLDSCEEDLYEETNTPDEKKPKRTKKEIPDWMKEK